MVTNKCFSWHQEVSATKVDIPVTVCPNQASSIGQDQMRKHRNAKDKHANSCKASSTRASVLAKNGHLKEENKAGF